MAGTPVVHEIDGKEVFQVHLMCLTPMGVVPSPALIFVDHAGLDALRDLYDSRERGTNISDATDVRDAIGDAESFFSDR